MSISSKLECSVLVEETSSKATDLFLASKPNQSGVLLHLLRGKLHYRYH